MKDIQIKTTPEEIINIVIKHIENRVDQDGKNGKDLPLPYIVSLLEELKEDLW